VLFRDVNDADNFRFADFLKREDCQMIDDSGRHVIPMAQFGRREKVSGVLDARIHDLMRRSRRRVRIRLRSVWHCPQCTAKTSARCKAICLEGTFMEHYGT
jgi:ubiquitin C-terminal hydrolase